MRGRDLVERFTKLSLLNAASRCLLNLFDTIITNSIIVSFVVI